MIHSKKEPIQALALRGVDAAHLCGVSIRTWREWLKSDNPPPSFKRGNCILHPVRELQDWLARQIQIEAQINN